MDVLYPIPLLVLASLGLGGLLLRRWRGGLSDLPIWLRSALAYFLGQGVLATVLLGIALAGGFGPRTVVRLLVLCALPLPWLLWQSRAAWRAALRGLWSGFLAAPLLWKLPAVMAAGLYLYGFGTLGGMPAGDAQAFYLAISKTTAYARELVPLPRYEDWSVMVGLHAEMLVAALIRLGMPYHLTRIYSWVNYLPTLVLLWGLAGLVGLRGRGKLLTLCVALTSSAALVLWGGGKTDLFAVGPAFACCLLALYAWRGRGPGRRWVRGGAIVLAGLFCGYAVVLKMSLLVVLLPSALLLLEWPALFGLAAAIRRRRGRLVLAMVRRGLVDGALFGVGALLMVLPQVAKNLWLGGPVFGFGATDTVWYSADTVRRLLLTYPFALTYGRYWAQYGVLSPLVLAFLPLLLFLPRRPWRSSALAAITTATCVGLLLWVLLLPAVFMPRYLLSALLLLGIPAAAAADQFSRRGGAAGLVVVFATAVTILFTPARVNTDELSFNWGTTWRQLTNPRDECLTAADMRGFCEAQQAINAAAPDVSGTQSRVMIASWYRVWLRAPLLLTANNGEDSDTAEWSVDPWAYLRTQGFRFVFLDPSHPSTQVLLDTLPAGCGVRQIYRDQGVSAYEILPAPTRSPGVPTGGD